MTLRPQAAAAAPEIRRSDVLTGGWQPVRVLGAAPASAFSGLALPAAAPTASQLYAPRGVLLDAPATAAGAGGPRATDTTGRLPTRLVAADTGNHRLLVWPELPAEDRAPAAVVVGQPDSGSEGPQAAGRGPERGLHLPTGLARAGDLLLVADGWNHRVVGFDAALDQDDPAPAWLLGQDGLADVEPNRGGEVDGRGLYWPFGLLWHEGWLWVADTGNRRVLGWHGLPDGRRPADVVLGQPSAHDRAADRGGAVGAATFRWPHALAAWAGYLWVADAGCHRLLGWRLPVTADRPADAVLGQPAFDTAAELPHVPQGPARLRFPYAVAAAGDALLVADTANNRVLGWAGAAGAAAAGAAASIVLGQDGFEGSGENRWTAVTPDSLCWPYGLSAARAASSDDGSDRGLLAVADSGNNRVVLWRRTGSSAPG